jgi:hypothetical protein
MKSAGVVLVANALSSTLLLFACASPKLAGDAKYTNVCDILKNPAKYSQMKVIIDDHVFTDFRRYAGVEDKRCLPHYLPFGKAPATPAGNTELEIALNRGGVEHRDVCATIEGVIVIDPKAYLPLYMSARRATNIRDCKNRWAREK